MATVTLREKADGSGVSACSSPDDKVGRGRCNHVPGGASMNMEREDDGTYTLEISDEFDSISVNAKKKTIKKFLDKMEKVDADTFKRIKESVDW